MRKIRAFDWWLYRLFMWRWNPIFREHPGMTLAVAVSFVLWAKRLGCTQAQFDHAARFFGALDMCGENGVPDAYVTCHWGQEVGRPGLPEEAGVPDADPV